MGSARARVAGRGLFCDGRRSGRELRTGHRIPVSGGTHVLAIGYVTLIAARGSPIAVGRGGGKSPFSLEKRKPELPADAAGIVRRLKAQVLRRLA